MASPKPGKRIVVICEEELYWVCCVVYKCELRRSSVVFSVCLLQGGLVWLAKHGALVDWSCGDCACLEEGLCNLQSGEL